MSIANEIRYKNKIDSKKNTADYSDILGRTNIKKEITILERE